MKTIKEDLGKVSVTAEGLWHSKRSYERITIVHDGLYSSYISRQFVPEGIMLGNPEYWQPIASLKEDIKEKLENLENTINDFIIFFNTKFKSSRMVVANENARNKLTYDEISIGCEVYELDTKKTFILDSIIPITNAKYWHLEN